MYKSTPVPQPDPALEHAYFHERALLAAIVDSPVVAVNRAIAIAETHGMAAGLAALDCIKDDPRLADYQPYWAARAGLLARAGEAARAQEAYDRAIGLEADPAVRRFLPQRRAELRSC